MASPYFPAGAAAFDGLSDVDAVPLPLPQRRRGSVAGGVPLDLPLGDSDQEDAADNCSCGSPGTASMGGMLSDEEAVARKALRGLAFGGQQQQQPQPDRRSTGSAHSSVSGSETEDEEDDADPDGAYVPSRSATALASKAASRPLDIPSSRAHAAHQAMASSARRASLPKNVMQQQHALHGGGALPVRAHMSSYAAGAQSTSMQSNALSPAAGGSSFLGRSFASAGGGDSGSAHSSSTETPLASSTAGALSSSASFYSGFVVAPSSLPQNQGLAPAVPLPLGSSSRRSSSPFVPDVALPHGGGSNGAGVDSPDGAAPHAPYSGGYNFALRRPSNAAAVPLLQAQLQARNASALAVNAGTSVGAGASSTNTSPHGTLRQQHLPYPAPSSHHIAAPVPAAASHSYTFSAASRFLSPSGIGASAVMASPYGSGAATSLSSSLSPLPPRPPRTPATSAALGPGMYASAPFGMHHGGAGVVSSTASTSAGSTPFDRSQYATPAPRCRTTSPAHVEEITSYEAVAACPPHEMMDANGSRRASVAPAPRRSLPPLRCAAPGELGDEEEQDMTFLTAPQPTASPGSDVGFELELEEDFGDS